MTTQSQVAEKPAELPDVEPSGFEAATRRRRRVRFRLRTLLLLPALVAALLLVAFPKLVTGDFVELTIASIDEDGASVTIEMDARVSAGTGWGATNALQGGGLGVSGKTQSHWTHLIPTWPRRQSIIINVRVSPARLPHETSSPANLLLIQQGEVYYVTPNSPLDLIHTRFANGKEGRCWFEASRGSRLGL